jgi:hypothetical protein
MIKVEKYNEVYLRIFSDRSIEQELSDFFKFRVKGYQYQPAYKNKLWDGFIRLFNLQTKMLYVGLLDYVIEFAERNDYEIEIPDELLAGNDISRDDAQRFSDSLNLSARGKSISLRDYQVNAVYRAISKNRVTILSPTSCLDPQTVIEVMLDQDAVKFLMELRG